MYKKIQLIYLLPLLLLTACTPKYLQWTAGKPLVWDDFMATFTGGYDANTSYTLRYTYHKRPIANKYEFDFNVQSLFVPYQSWVKQGMASPTLLQHEQLHFDIAELYTRKLYLSLNRHTYTNNYRTEIRGIATTTIKEMRETQANYDRETAHFFNTAAQAQWQTLINQQLAQTPEYPHVELSVKQKIR